MCFDVRLTYELTIYEGEKKEGMRSCEQSLPQPRFYIGYF